MVYIGVIKADSRRREIKKRDQSMNEHIRIATYFDLFLLMHLRKEELIFTHCSDLVHRARKKSMIFMIHTGIGGIVIDPCQRFACVG